MPYSSSYDAGHARCREVVDTRPDYSIRPADFYAESDAAAIREIIDAYARTPAGGGYPLEEDVRQRLVDGLQVTPGAFAILAFAGATPIGVAVCFQTYSTFAARPLVNIHDLAVQDGYRGQGIGTQLLRAVEAHARVLGGCKVTLEVRDSNTAAESLYRRCGYTDPNNSPTRFLEHLL